ncbi:antibiotic biosynthesis monooxygenase [Paenibacillus sp. F411]|uniref:antibiotic biosynthesis monooxygenase n=1 Tax=Paenibacillus sp. F411 TaxID=2820239 RepID=UPI001AAFE179|nr:antibiotic biosynthesis monooxygenase [Paenibacillus sp. F411]MBO2944673.1 antibiotic biosynthesis monooxygenase [Paenibacillus sp. F411]
MLVVTNTIKVTPGYGKELSQRFAQNKGVQNMPGFIRLEVWHEAKEGQDYEELKVCTVWENEDAFKGWTSSESFRQAHRGGGSEHMLGASLNKYELLVSHPPVQ